MLVSPLATQNHLHIHQSEDSHFNEKLYNLGERSIFSGKQRSSFIFLPKHDTENDGWRGGKHALQLAWREQPCLEKMITNFWIDIPPLSEPTATLRPDVVLGGSPGRLRQGPEGWSKGGPRRREAPEGNTQQQHTPQHNTTHHKTHNTTQHNTSHHITKHTTQHNTKHTTQHTAHNRTEHKTLNNTTHNTKQH